MTKYWIDNLGEIVVATDDSVNSVVGAVSYTQTPPVSGKDKLVDGEWVRSISADDIKEEARRRIDSVMPSWVVVRSLTGGQRIPANVLSYSKSVREASDTLEVSLPDDFKDDSHWPAKPSSVDYGSVPTLTRKDEIWDRCTDAEAELLMAALEQAPAKLRGMWMDNPYISHNHKEFNNLRAAIVTVLGGNPAAETRADELLEESEVL